jgi:ribonuclease BN (tRNA processing enzyme)
MFSWNNLKEYKLETPNNKLTLIGSSVAGNATSFYIKERNILLDCGIPSDYKPKVIIITHMHYDHVCSIVRYFLDMDNDRTYKPVIICPEKSVKLLIQYIESAFRLTKNIFVPNKQVSLPEYIIIGSTLVNTQDKNNSIILDVNRHSDKIITDSKYVHTNRQQELLIESKLDIRGMKVPYEIEPIRCNHGGQPTHGYGFIELRTKLKDEYFTLDSSGKRVCKLSKKELYELKKNNKLDTMKDIIKVPIFAYICDTDHKVFLRDHKYEGYKLDKYPVIIIECTFFKDGDIKKAKKDKHMHWFNLRKYILEHPNKYFKLIHISNKYTSTDIQEFQSIINRDKLDDRVTIIH